MDAFDSLFIKFISYVSLNFDIFSLLSLKHLKYLDLSQSGGYDDNELINSFVKSLDIASTLLIAPEMQQQQLPMRAFQLDTGKPYESNELEFVFNLLLLLLLILLFLSLILINSLFNFSIKLTVF